MQDHIAQALAAASKPARLHFEGGGASESIDGGNVGEGFDFMGGFLKSSGFGRTDTLPINVPNGAYVLPADIVSGLGQGNSIAGAKVLDRVFSGMPYGANGGPYGASPVNVTHGEGPPKPPPMKQPPEMIKPGEKAKIKPEFSRGGLVPIIAAGGEYVIHPDIVRHLGDGDLSEGHKRLDKFVKDTRAKTHKTLGKLPGPAK